MPDDELEIPGGEGEPISQEDLDALLANTEAGGDADDAEALGGFGPEAESPMSDEDMEGLVGEGMSDGFGMEDGGDAGFNPPMGGARIGLEAFDIEGFPTPAASDSDDPGFQRVRDIPIDVTVELGRTRMLIRDILDLATGAIVELDKIAGEPVDLFANGLLVARGEVIVIDDNFGVRVTEIITADDRLKANQEHSMAA
jgi:flagellar motor switch protein FliN